MKNSGYNNRQYRARGQHNFCVFGCGLDIGWKSAAFIIKQRCCIMLFGVLLLLTTGCSTPTGSYQAADFGGLPQYSEIAKTSMDYEGVMRNPIIIVHGFLGAKLQDINSGEETWGRFYGMTARNLTPQRLRQLGCPMIYGTPLPLIPNNARPIALLSNMEVDVAGVAFYFAAYDILIKELTNCGYTPDGDPLPAGKHFYSLFKFSYDWRYDLAWNAKKLHQFVLEKKAYLQKEYEKLYGLKDFDVQFDLVAHSMGGLLTRYYLRYGQQELAMNEAPPELDWRGSRHVDKALIIGTPNAGYLDTWYEMLHGLQLQAGAPLFPPGIIGTFHTYYQMLPPLSTKSIVYADAPDEAVDIFDPEVWVRYQWGIADPKQDKFLQNLLPSVKDAAKRRKIAIEHLGKCLARAKKFIELMRVHATPPVDVNLALFAGDAFATRRRAVIDRTTGRIVRIDMEPGDGKVLASSARFDEREGQEWAPFLVSPINWAQVMYLPAAHMGLMACPTFVSNATFFLWMRPTSHQKKKLERFRK